MKSIDNSSQNKNEGVLKPLGLSSSVAIIYIIFFVSISLVADKNITMDKLALPAVALYLLVSVLEYFFSKKNKNIPKALSIVSFTLSIITAILIALMVK